MRFDQFFGALPFGMDTSGSLKASLFESVRNRLGPEQRELAVEFFRADAVGVAHYLDTVNLFVIESDLLE